MTKIGEIAIFGTLTIVIVVAILIFAVDWKNTADIEEINKEGMEDEIIDSENFINQTLSTKEIRDMVPSRPISESELREWKSYTSEKLGISFKYPPQYIVVEAKETDTPIIGTSVFLMILEDTLHNRQYAKIKNPDFDYDIPEDRKNVDIEPSQGISFFKSTEGGFTQDIVGRYKSEKIADRSVSASADFIGIDSVVYQAEGLFTFDGVIFENKEYLYQFIVQYYNSPESPRDNFYKIISTVKFK
jgi:hypothetical protein